MSIDDLQRYESEVELDLYRQYREVVGMFRHVVETERRTGAAVALLVDLSYSMALRGTWGAAKSTAMAMSRSLTVRI